MVALRNYLIVLASVFFFSAVVFYHSAEQTIQRIESQRKLAQSHDADERETWLPTGTGCACRHIGPSSPSTSMVSTCSYEADQRKNGQRVVSYSLFGDTNEEVIKRRYFSSLEARAARVAHSYPGWVMRIYHNISLSDEHELCQIFCRHDHVDLCDINKLQSSEVNQAMVQQLNPRMWRFLAMIDPLVDVFMSRDIDSDIIDREVAAVEQWLKSNWTFHVMRDHPSHGGFMLAGLWGAKIYLRRTLIQGMGHSMVWTSQNDRYETDQRRLDLVVWPFATFDVMAHDSYFCNNWFIVLGQMVPSYPFPTQRVGRNYTGYDVVRTDIADHIQRCPLECRPRMHKNWEYC